MQPVKVKDAASSTRQVNFTIAEWKEKKRQEALVRQARREGRSKEKQMELLSARPGDSKKERARLDK